MIEVEIRNFQSIEHIVVRVDGFTALVGKSNIGKSAIVRAVKAALTGAPVDDFVRHGPDCPRLLKDAKSCKCACSVHIRAQGFDLFWEKGDAVNRYVLNGKEYTVAGKGTPEFLQDTFALAKIGDTKELLQVANQFDPIFLLDESGTVIADVLSDVARLDRINVAMRMVERDRKEAIASRKLREKDVMDLKIKVLTYDGLDDVLARVREVEADEQVVEAAKQRAAHIERLLSNAFPLAREIRALAAASKVEIPDAAEVRQGYAAYEKLVQLAASIVEKQASIDTLEGFEGLEVPDADPLKEKCAAFGRLEVWVEKVRAFKDLFVRWKTLETVPDETRVNTALSRFVSANDLAGRFDAAVASIRALEQSRKDAEKEEVSVQKEIDALGVCPTCTKPLGASGKKHIHHGVAGA